LTISQLETKATELRIQILQLIARAGAGHLGGSLSSADIITALFYNTLRIRPKEPRWPGRDRFILSKGTA
jgi:transketolase